MQLSNDVDKFTTTATQAIVTAEQIAGQYDRVVAVLREHCGTAVIRLAVNVGRVVIDEFFQGAEENFVDRNRYKETRFADFLRERADDLAEIGLAERTLRNYVHAFLVWRTLPAPVQEASNVATLQELSRLKNPLRRVALAHESTEGHWPVRKLREVIDVEIESEAPTGDGKPKKPAVYKAVAKAEKLTRSWTYTSQELAGLSKREKTTMLNHAASLRARLDAVESALRA